MTNSIKLSGSVEERHNAQVNLNEVGSNAILCSAKVVDLSRNIIVTGDDCRHVQCDPSLDESRYYVILVFVQVLHHRINPILVKVYHQRTTLYQNQVYYQQIIRAQR